ncbi:hypothetical protein [Nocardia sp. NPDC048505]|uniref:hypothetical protein n=1 Tax=unclassified Nocardia TaxID=2637762 RepID=UPI0033CD783E
MSYDFAAPPTRSREDAARTQISAFIAELVRAGIRPTHHSRRLDPERRESIAVVGWSVGGCRGLWRGCEPGCDLVVTTKARLVRICDQPDRTRLRRARPVYLEPAEYPDLTKVLSAGRALLLPRLIAA